MKILRVVLLALLFAVAAFALPQETMQVKPSEPQAAAQPSVTTDWGLGAFANSNGPILLAIDSSLASRTLKNPYVMFYAFMAAKNMNQNISVASKDIILVYKDKELTMPTLKELRTGYNGITRDYDLYKELGKEGIKASWIKLYDFPRGPIFFPRLDLRADLAAEFGHMHGVRGFKTPLYFKNPGFAKGDKLLFKVRDDKNAALTGECGVVIQ